MIRGVLDQHLAGTAYRAFLFGSQANQPELKRSDIDVGIWPEATLSGSTLGAILMDLEELPMLYPVDVVDFSRARESFRQVALQNTEPL